MLKEKIISKKANINTNDWKLFEVKIFNNINGLFSLKKKSTYEINSIYDYEKINNFLEILIQCPLLIYF